MEARNVPHEKWAAALKPLLAKKYSAVSDSLSATNRRDWDKLTEALLNADECYTSQAPSKFFNEQKRVGESFPRYGSRLSKYSKQITKAMEQTEQLIQINNRYTTEKFIDTLPYSTQTYVRERMPDSITKACFYVEQHFSHHRWSVSNYIGGGQWYQEHQENPQRNYQQQHRQNDYNPNYRSHPHGQQCQSG